MRQWVANLIRDVLQGADTDPALVEKVQLAMLEGEQTSIEYVTYYKSGTKFWSSLSIKPVCSDDGKLEHFVGANNDNSHNRGFRIPFRRG